MGSPRCPGRLARLFERKQLERTNPQVLTLRPQFVPDIQYWLNANHTYRVVFIQDQASWFVITGHDFIVNAHNTGGIQGNGQPWWNYYTTVPRLDGDGRPLALTLYQVERGLIKDFRIENQPFWCNAVAESKDVIYDGMMCNATNTNPEFAGQKWVNLSGRVRALLTG